MRIRLRDNEVRELEICLGRIENKRRDFEDAQRSYHFQMNTILVDRQISLGRVVKNINLLEKYIDLEDLSKETQAERPEEKVERKVERTQEVAEERKQEEPPKEQLWRCPECDLIMPIKHQETHSATHEAEKEAEKAERTQAPPKERKRKLRNERKRKKHKK